ncbi:Ppx/GppA phosphatase family protein [Iodidimonas muriae]|nr:Ppx/GppA phosphatase family protein [Iodidimonas muriae]
MSVIEDKSLARPVSADEARPRRAGPVYGGRAVYSAIDLGTNNCRLLVAKPTRNGFRVIDAFSRIVRLGEGLELSGRLSDAAMDRAVGALKICAQKIKSRKVTCMRSVATEACRAAVNCSDFVARVKRETGLNLDVISPAEEARLAVVGCQSLMDQRYSHALVFDIGGGSTELIFIEKRTGGQFSILAWTSVPFGVTTIAERFDCHSLSSETYKEMVALIANHLADFEELGKLVGYVKRGKVQLLGTSGTITTLASVQLGLKRYDRSRIDGAWLRAGSVHALARAVALMPYEERLAQPCIGEDRVDYVVAGCAILDAILTQWPFTRIRVADRGIREGVLRGLMNEGVAFDTGHNRER